MLQTRVECHRHGVEEPVRMDLQLPRRLLVHLVKGACALRQVLLVRHGDRDVEIHGLFNGARHDLKWVEKGALVEVDQEDCLSAHRIAVREHGRCLPNNRAAGNVSESQLPRHNPRAGVFVREQDGDGLNKAVRPELTSHLEAAIKGAGASLVGRKVSQRSQDEHLERIELSGERGRVRRGPVKSQERAGGRAAWKSPMRAQTIGSCANTFSITSSGPPYSR